MTLGFFREMMVFFDQKFDDTIKETFVAGFSNGGAYVFKLAKERPNIFQRVCRDCG